MTIAEIQSRLLDNLEAEKAIYRNRAPGEAVDHVAVGVIRESNRELEKQRLALGEVSGG